MVHHPEGPERSNQREIRIKSDALLSGLPKDYREPAELLNKRCDLDPAHWLRFLQMYPERAQAMNIIFSLAENTEIPDDILQRMIAASGSEAAIKRFSELSSAIVEIRRIRLTDRLRQEIITIISEAAVTTYQLPQLAASSDGNDLLALAIIISEGANRRILKDSPGIVPHDVRIVPTLLNYSLVDIVRDFFEFKQCAKLPDFLSVKQLTEYFQDHRFIISKSELSDLVFTPASGDFAGISLKTLGRAFASKRNQLSPRSAELLVHSLGHHKLPKDFAHYLALNLASARLTNSDVERMISLVCCLRPDKTADGPLNFLRALSSNDFSPSDRARGLNLLAHILSSGPTANDLAVLSEVKDAAGIAGLERQFFGEQLRAFARVVPDRPIGDLVNELLSAKARGLDAPDEAVILETAAIVDKIFRSGLSVNVKLPPDFSRIGSDPEPAKAFCNYWEIYGSWARAWCKDAFGFAPNTAQLFAVIMGARQMEKSKELRGRGAWIELATGEGKSLVLALMAGYQLCRGKNVFVTAPNRYLADRDAELFAPLFETLGARLVGTDEITQETILPPQALVAYSPIKDLIYASIDAKANRRKLFTGASLDVILLDEVDALLIDNGVRQHWRYQKNLGASPGQTEAQHTYWSMLHAHRSQLSSDPLSSAAYLAAKIPQTFGAVDPILLSLHASSAFHSTQLRVGIDYAISGKDVVIIDRLETERLMPSTVWIHGLHRLVSVGKQLPLPVRGLLRGNSSPYELLSSFEEIFCCSGTVGNQSERSELRRTYGLIGSHIPSNNRAERVDHPLHLYRTNAELFSALAAKVDEVHISGRPILVVADSIRQAFALKKLIDREVCLKRKASRAQLITDLENRATTGERAREEDLIDRAGQLGMITVATAMVGRGTDIRLSDESLRAGGLFVIVCGTPRLQRGEAQIRRRAARQGQPGSSIVLSSMESDRFIKSLPANAQVILSREVNSKGYSAGAERFASMFEFCRNALTLLQSTKRQLMVKHQAQISHAIERYVEQKWSPLTEERREDLTMFPAQVANLVINHLIKIGKFVPSMSDLEDDGEEFLELRRLFEESFKTKPPPVGAADEEISRLFEVFAHKLRVSMGTAEYLSEQGFFEALMDYSVEFNEQVASHNMLRFEDWEGSA